MSPDDAIKSVSSGGYLSASEEDLRALLAASLHVSGSNPPYLHRANQAAEIIRSELASRFLSGAATWLALKRTTEELCRIAPPDHDVIILVSDIRVDQARFIEPHSFLFEGLDSGGRQAKLIVHFSQLQARVVYLPKRGPDRVVTGFAPLSNQAMEPTADQ
jgi:hypothetical protein